MQSSQYKTGNEINHLNCMESPQILLEQFYLQYKFPVQVAVMIVIYNYRQLMQHPQLNVAERKQPNKLNCLLDFPQ